MSTQKIDQIYIRLGEKRGETLKNRLINNETVSNRLSFSTISLILISTCVHLIGPILIGLAILILSHTAFNVLSGISEFFLLFLGFFSLPKPTKKPINALDRTKYKTLYNYVNSISKELGGKPIHSIVVDEQWNASIHTYGWRRHTCLTIGLPLWNVLSDGEKNALISHEIGHMIHSDILKSIYIWSAHNTLVTWYLMLQPVVVQENRTLVGGLIALSRLVMKGISYLILGVIHIIIHLYWMDSQEQEYKADAITLKVCEKEDVINLFYKLYQGERMSLSVQQFVHQKLKISFFDYLATQMGELTEEKKEQLKATIQLEKARLNATHPPLGYRMDYIATRENQLSGKKSFDPSSTASELDHLKDVLQRRIIDRYKESLYY